MNREEVKVLLAGLSRFYPPHLMPPIDADTINTWTDMLQDLDSQMAMYATKAWVSMNKYPPTIADIRERCTQMVAEPRETAEQAWSRVYKAIRSCGHTEPDRAEKELGELWQLVGRDWAYYCSLEESQTPNEKARFIRMYQAEQKKAVERRQIPNFVQKSLRTGTLLLLEAERRAEDDEN